MPQKGVLECSQQFDALFAQGREVAADAAKHGNALLGAEAAGDLLLHFDHAQISLGLVVIKGDRKIVQEAQHGPLALAESIQQIASRALFGSPWGSLGLVGLAGCSRRGIGLIALDEELIIATKQACQQQQIQLVLAQGFSPLDLGFHFQQEILHLASPSLLEFFLYKGQFSQVMDIAPGVGEAVALIALQSIMDAGASKQWRNANGIKRFAPAALMSRVVGEPISRADVDPPSRLAHAQCGFIRVGSRLSSPKPL